MPTAFSRPLQPISMLFPRNLFLKKGLLLPSNVRFSSPCRFLFGKPTERKEEDDGSEKNKPISNVEKSPRPSSSNYDLGSDWIPATKKKPAKVKVSWVCENCGATPGQWWGTCPSCHSVNTVKKISEYQYGVSNGFQVSEMAARSWLEHGSGEMVPQSLEEVKKGMNQLEWRIPLPGAFGMEVARVLGGGLVPGSLVLFGGDPGIGKSTLLLQIAACLAEGLGSEGLARVLYVSGEESMDQIGNRADRMQISETGLYLYSSTDVEDILDKIRVFSPKVLVIDSIQTVYLRGVVGSAGNVMQVKECTSALLRFAKQTSIPVLLIGHVTKSGDIAGPRILEHIVDVVLYLEGERCSTHRLLRSVKNRFGSTDELGVFEMSETGLQAVLNPSELFLSDSHHHGSEVLAGLAVSVVIEGSRTFLLEIQALCASGSTVVRHVNGVSAKRADMLISVLMKQAGLKLENTSIFINVVSGFTLTETAGDLALAAAICSSFLEFALPNNIAFIGEVGLAGELRTVPRMDKRVATVAKLGYSKCVVPASAMKSLAGLQLDIAIVHCCNLTEFINRVFRVS
ncbi:DNA repair protein RadA-like protein [Wolffia australiana]